MEMGRLRKSAELAIRLPDELNAEAEQAVEEDEGADELARLVARLGLPEHPREDREQDEAFEDRFVKLARVARRAEDRAERRGFDKAHRPGNGRRRAPQLLVDEVREPAEEQAEGRAAGDIIVDPEPRQFLLAREIDDPERCPHDTAVERHAAIPQLQ